MPMLPGTFHIDLPLTNSVQGLYNLQRQNIARSMFAVIPVNYQSGIYYKIDTAAWLRDQARGRPLNAGAEFINYGASTGSYFCQEYTLGHKIDDRVRANQNVTWNLDLAGARMLTTTLGIRENVYWASSFWKTGVWGTDVATVTTSPVAGTSILRYDQSGSDPVADIWYYKEYINSITGFMPNRLAIGIKVFTNWINHSVFRTRLQYTSAGSVTLAMIAELFGLEEVVVLQDVYNVAPEGAAASLAYIANSKSMLLTYRAPDGFGTLDASQPTGGMLTAWTGLLGGAANGDGIVVQTGRDPDWTAKSDIIAASSAWGQQLVWPQVGVFFDTVVP